jgi:hypothetical protein
MSGRTAHVTTGGATSMHVDVRPMILAIVAPKGLGTARVRRVALHRVATVGLLLAMTRSPLHPMGEFSHVRQCESRPDTLQASRMKSGIVGGLTGGLLPLNTGRVRPSLVGPLQ